MPATQTKSLTDVIKERHSVRTYDANFKIPKEEIEDMLKMATLAPSSSNLQPWRFIIIQNQEAKKELRQIAYGQEQVETASAVIAVLGDKEMYQNVKKIQKSAFEQGYIEEDNLNRLIENTNNLYPKLPEDVRKNIVSFDAGLLSMQLMLIAKERGYDTVPMGGFDKEKFAKKYNLSDRFFPIILLPIGKAAAPAHMTTRLPLEDVVFKV